MVSHLLPISTSICKSYVTQHVFQMKNLIVRFFIIIINI